MLCSSDSIRNLEQWCTMTCELDFQYITAAKEQGNEEKSGEDESEEGTSDRVTYTTKL